MPPNRSRIRRGSPRSSGMTCENPSLDWKQPTPSLSKTCEARTSLSPVRPLARSRTPHENFSTFCAWFFLRGLPSDGTLILWKVFRAVRIGLTRRTMSNCDQATFGVCAVISPQWLWAFLTLNGWLLKYHRFTPSKILLYICIPEARFVGVIVTW